MILFLVFAASLDLTVIETAGIRRFSYPVKVKLAFNHELTGKEKFRLLDDKKPMAAQFRPDGKRAVWLDFDLSTAPLDKRRLKVEYGPDVEAGPEGKDGESVKEEKGTFVVRYGPTYAVPADLGGLLGAVGGGKTEYVKPGSKGLWFETVKGRQAVSGLKGVIARQGPIATALAFTGKVGDADVFATLTFPRSKSWVEVEVGANAVKALGADLKLDFATPGLVDFGAGTGVYVALKKGQTAAMEAMSYVRPRGHSWSTSVDGVPHVVGRGSPAEGWVHAMDRTRCTAVAVEHFGGVTGVQDRIEIDAEGGLRLTRRNHRIRFWLHFVPMPPHVGAVTSPRSMMSPLQVEVHEP